MQILNNVKNNIYTLIEIFSIFMYHNIFIHMRYNSILRIKIALIIN